MYNLAIDTCTWINLGRKYTEVRRKISVLVEQGKVRLIVPEIVIQEWNKHKQDKVLASKKSSIQEMIKNARALSQYLKHEQSEEFKEIVEGFQNQTEQIEKLASEDVQAIDLLFEHPSTIRLPIEDGVKFQAVELALAKKAPFREKNSMADALILLATINYVSTNSLTNCMFISDNTNDFSSKTDKIKPHEDLYDLFDKNAIKYFINIGLAINEIEKDLVSNKEINEIEKELQFEASQKVFENYRQNVINIDKMAEALGTPAMKKMAEVLSTPAMKKMAEVLRTPAMEKVAEVLRTPAMEKMIETQQQLAEALGTPTMKKVAEALRTPAMEKMAEALRNPALETFFKQQQRVAEALRNPVINRIAEKQQGLKKINALVEHADEDTNVDDESQDEFGKEDSNGEAFTNDDKQRGENR